METYELVITGSARKSVKKLPREAREEILGAGKILEKNPFAGEKLSGSLHFLYTFHFRVEKVEYRLAYTIRTDEKQIVIHLAHTRENFYDKLRRLFR